MFRTDNIFVAIPVWEAINSGLIGNALKVNGFTRDAWDPSNKGLAFTEDGIYRCTNLRGVTPTWTQVLSNAQINTLTGVANCTVKDLKASICQNGLIFAVVGPNGTADRYCLRSVDGGVTWTLRAQIVGTCPFNPGIWGIERSNYVGAEARLGNLYISSHNANKLWVFGSTCANAANKRSTIVYSLDQGATWSVVNEAVMGLGTWSGGSVPYHNNISDQRMYIWGWGTLGTERKSIDGGTTKTAIAPSGNVRFKGMIMEHTWNDQLVLAVAESGGLYTNAQLSISLNQASSWGAPIALGMPVWSLSGFPYNEQLSYFGRAILDAALGNNPLRDYPLDPNAPLIKITQDQGANILDKSGNLRAGFNVKSITQIAPNWLAD